MDSSLNSNNIKHKFKVPFPENGNLKNRQFERICFILLLFVVAFAFLIRFSLLFIHGLPWFSTDTYDYMNMADAILSGHPIAKFPNGLPLLIASIKIFVSPEKLPSVLICLNVILSTLIVYMVAIITTKITKKKHIGIIAALIVALYPNQLNYTRLILSEVPTCFLLTLCIFVFFKKNYFISGLILFFATLFRSDLLLVFPLLFLVSLFYLHKEHKTIKALYFISGYVLGVIFYSILLNYGIVTSTNRYGLEILKSINANSIKEEYPSTSNFSEDEKSHPMKTYIKFILSHPTIFVKNRLFALENMWGWPPAPIRSFNNKFLIAIRFPVFIFGIIGFWKYRDNFDAWVILMPIVALSIVHIALYSSPRYTFSVEPLLICLASASLTKRAINQ